MKIKKYLANNLPQAMSMVRQELGREAIILSTRRLKLGGVFGMFGRPAVEVTAAVNESERKLRRERKQARTLLDYSPIDIEGTYTRAGVKVEHRSSRAGMVVDDEPTFETMEAKMVELAPLADVGTETESTEPAGTVRAFDRDRSGPVCQQTALNENQVTVVMLIGPTGSGKTMTIGKLAAHLSAKHGATITLLTVDSAKIASIHQLKAYADVLGTVAEVCYTPEELSAAIGEAGDSDVVLIDTPGRSFMDPKSMAELKAFVQAAAPDEVHLALPCTMSESSAVEAADKFGTVGYNRILLTKADEAGEFSLIPTVIRATGQPISYICHGQKVPEDIAPASEEHLAELVSGAYRRVQAASSGR